MTFYTFMMRRYKYADGPAGALARDMQSDALRFPRNRPCKFRGWHDLISGYLTDNGACPSCLDTFETCWQEYVEYEKGKK